MNAKHFATSLAIALAGSSALAIEATQLEVPASVAAPAATTPPSARVLSYGEATQFVDAPPARDREAVRAEARGAVRVPNYNPLYVGA